MFGYFVGVLSGLIFCLLTGSALLLFAYLKLHQYFKARKLYHETVLAHLQTTRLSKLGKTLSTFPYNQLQPNTNESCNWLNYLIKRITKEMLGRINQAKLQSFINQGLKIVKKPFFLPFVKVKSFQISHDLPEIKEIKVYKNEKGSLALEIFFRFGNSPNKTEEREKNEATISKEKSFLQLKISTCLSFNIPNFRKINFPISCFVGLEHLIGSARIVVPNKSNAKCRFCLGRSSKLSLKLIPRFGRWSGLFKIPLINKLAQSCISFALSEYIMEPNQQEFLLPISEQLLQSLNQIHSQFRSLKNNNEEQFSIN
ncbi:maintenance of morphology protein [Anaeramoeba flamelloides]|uniref:Maintenance of morphology protein n=1 Tax=Anaeramoeba flamelloides TaxID=1746091 RepID=A0ABQ8Y6P3_9EUKA|nr:maintenance of morphology protein [Anaeramoeba flamelloides]